jgi:hypothetical protein
MKPFNSKKTELSVIFVWTSLVISIVAVRAFGFETDAVVGVLQCFSAVLCCHVLGHSITDAAASWGIKAKEKA